MPKSFKNILIIKPSSLGDIVHALPTLSVLRKSFPDAKISWLVRPEFAGILKNHPYLNEIILFDRKLLGKALYNSRAFGALIRLIRELRCGKFDAVIDLQGLFRTGSLGWLSGCKKRLGMANARELGHIFYTDKIEQDQDCIYIVDYYLKIVSQLNSSETINGQQQAVGRDNSVECVLPNEPDAGDSVRRLLARHDISADSYAVFIPSSARCEKFWPIERFAVLAGKISSAFGLSVIATATASEKGIIDRLAAVADVPIANFAGLTDLVELTTLLRGAKLVVSNDTGPGHIAAALGVPMVMIFGPTNPVRLFSRRRPEAIAAVKPFERGIEIDSNDPAYVIEAITVDEVYQKVCGQLNSE